MGPFESEVERMSEGFMNPLSAVASKLIGPLLKGVARLRSLGPQLKEIAVIWREAQDEAGARLKPSPILLQAAELAAMASAAQGEASNAPDRPVGESQHRLPRVEPLKESLTLMTLVSLVLATVGGLPMLFNVLTKTARFMRLTRLANVLGAATKVLQHIEHGVVDVLIPDRLSYQLYKRTWARGFKASPDLMEFDEYRHSHDVRPKVESAMYSLLLVYFAWHGLMGVMHAGATLLGAAEATATTVKGIEIARGVKDVTGILRGTI